MKTRSSRTAFRSAGVLMLAVGLGGCGLLAGPSEAETVALLLDTSSRIQSSVDQLVSLASSTGQTMSEEFRANSARVEATIEDFNEATDHVEDDVLLRSEAEAYAQAANLVTGLLADGTIDVAAEVMRTQVTPRYQTLRERLLTRQAELGGADTGSNTWLVVIGIAAVAFGTFVMVQRRRPTLVDKLTTPATAPVPVPRPTTKLPEGRTPEPEVFTSPLSGVHLPEIGHHEPRNPAPAPTGPVRNPEALHSVRGGLRTVELKGIIDAALATIVDAGWEVAIECPPVHVLVDPLRMRRLLSNLLLSATAHGAEHIGLVAVIVGDKVEINVGHDGSLLRGISEDASSPPPEVDHQITVAKQMLGGMHAEVRWTNWRGVSLYTIELVRGPDEPADDVDRLAANAD